MSDLRAQILSAIENRQECDHERQSARDWGISLTCDECDADALVLFVEAAIDDAKNEVRQAGWAVPFDYRSWANPAHQKVAVRVVDAILRDVFQGKRDHLRDQMLATARRDLTKLPEWKWDESMRAAQAQALKDLVRHCFDENDAAVTEGGMGLIEVYVFDQIAALTGQPQDVENARNMRAIVDELGPRPEEGS